MTEAQAHQFVARWNRIIFPRRVRTEAETIREVRFRLLFFTSITFLFAIGLGLFLIFSRQIFPVIVPEILHFCLSIFGIWNIFLLRQARYILDQSQIANRKS
jgi:hypothetical protein